MSDGRGEEKEEAAAPKNVTGNGGGGFDGRLSWRQFLGSADRLLQVSGAVDDNNSSSTASTTSASAVSSSKWTSRKISVSVISSTVSVHVCVCLCFRTQRGGEAARACTASVLSFYFSLFLSVTVRFFCSLLVFLSFSLSVSFSVCE